MNVQRGKHPVMATLIVALAVIAASASVARADSLEADARAALASLKASSEPARQLAGLSKAVLVFPKVFKAGFIVGGQYGKGVLLRGDKAVGRYNVVAGSYGLQAGAQGFGYAMFLMTYSAVAYLDRSDGWEVGVGPSVVVVDKGFGKSVTSTTLKSDVYGFIFNQQGLMAGIGLQGSKITRLKD